MSMSHTDTQFKPFVVIFQGRSGSTYLMEALNSHPQIDSYLEILAPLKKKIKKGKIKPSDQLKTVRKCLSEPSSTNISAIGFKTKLKDVIDPDSFATVLKQTQAKIICLTRRNQIKRVVSLERAIKLNESTGDWNLYQPESKPKAFAIDVDEFKIWLKQSEREKLKILNYVHDLGLPTLYLFYEDLIKHSQTTFEEIFAFLEVQSHPLEASCIKNTNDNLREEILNFDDLRSCYVGTPYEEMFDEVIVC